MKTGPIGQLNTAQVRQKFVDVLGKLRIDSDEGETAKIGGLMVVNDRLIGSAYIFYDANGNQRLSHFKLSSLELSTAEVTGMFPVGSQGGGWVGGWMTAVPADWQKPLGASYVTGQGALSIISRTSYGPSLFGFDPQQLGTVPARTTTLLGYPQANPLRRFDSQNDCFNGTTQIRGIAFPDGTDSILFFGSHGTGPLTYGDGGSQNGDPARTEKGYHAYPYRFQVWAYDARQLVAVKTGRTPAWKIQPYAVWSFELPYPQEAKRIGGVTYDRVRKRIFVSQQGADEWGLPIIHAFDLALTDKGP